MFKIIRLLSNGLSYYLTLCFVVGDTVAADVLDNIAELLDFGNQRIDVLLRYLEIGIVARFDISPLQEVEQPFFLLRITRENLEYFSSMFLCGIHQLRQIVAFVAIEDEDYRNYTQQVFN